MRTKKHKHKSWQGLRVTICVAQSKNRKRERWKRQNTAAKKQNYPLCMCVCMNENAASLQPADPCHSLCVCFTESWVFLDRKRCWLSAEGSNSGAGVNHPLTGSLYAAVPSNYYKYNNKYKYSTWMDAKKTGNCVCRTKQKRNIYVMCFRHLLNIGLLCCVKQFYG